MSGFLSNLGAHFGIGGGAHQPTRKLPPGNDQWAQLANFFPQDNKTANGLDLATEYGGGLPMDKKGQHVDVAGALSALQSLAQPQAPPPPDPMQFAPMPQSRFLPGLQGAPQLGQRQMMPAPAQYSPYMWGPR